MDETTTQLLRSILKRLESVELLQAELAVSRRKFRKRSKPRRHATNKTRAEAREIFDEDFYARQVRSSLGTSLDCDAYEDYSERGFMHGFNPSPLFDTRFVQHNSTYIHPSDSAPLELWVESEFLLGPNPHPMFDSEYYRRRYEIGSENPLSHYLRIGIGRGHYISFQHELRSKSPHIHELSNPSSEENQSEELKVEFHSRDQQPRAISALSEIDPSDYGLITCDFWDTLVVRNRHPEAAKMETGGRIKELFPEIVQTTGEIYDVRVSIEQQMALESPTEEYSLRSVLDRVLVALSDQARLQLPDDHRRSAVDSLAYGEVASEAANIEVQYSVVEFLAKAAESGARVAILSDHFFGSSDLRKILEFSGSPFIPVDIHSSCELGASKRLGTAFQKIRNHYLIGDLANRLHIGDNIEADVRNALDGGFDAIHIVPSNASSYSDKFRDQYNPDQKPHAPVVRDGVFRLKRLIDSMTAIAGRTGESEPFQEGIKDSLLPTLLVIRATECAHQMNLPNVFYLGREGHFLAQVHNKINASAKRNEIQPISIDISRKSVFPPSLAVCERQVLERVAGQYSSQSVGAFIRMLGLEDDVRIRTYLDRFALDWDEVLPDVLGDERLSAMMIDSGFKSLKDTHCSTQHDFLREYLMQRGFDISSGSHQVVCDIGWRGTVQDLLALSFPGLKTHGVYLGLFPKLVASPSQTSKEGLAFNGDDGDRFDYVDPPAAIEGPWTYQQGSPERYFKTSSGLVRPRHGKFQETEVSSTIREYQRGVQFAAPVLAEKMRIYGLDVSDLRWLAQNELQRFYASPSNTVSDVWFESDWDESFGSGLELPYKKIRPNASLIDDKSTLESSVQATLSRWPTGWMEWTPTRNLRALRGLLHGD